MCVDDLIIDRRETGTPGSTDPRDIRRNKLKTESGLQLIAPLETEHLLLAPDKVPEYRVPQPAHTPKKEGSRRQRRQKNKNQPPINQEIEEDVPDAENEDLQEAMMESYRESRNYERQVRRGPSEETE